MAFNNSSSQNTGIFTLEEYALNIPVLFSTILSVNQMREHLECCCPLLE